jgi:hypothetical protein
MLMYFLVSNGGFEAADALVAGRFLPAQVLTDACNVSADQEVGADGAQH